MSKRRRLRRFLAVLILLAVIVVAGWTGLWYVIAGRLADHVLAWEQQQRSEGWTITQGTPSRTGWPMAAGIILPDVAVSGGDQYLRGGVAWRAAALTLALDIRHPNDLYLGMSGRQTVAAAGGPAVPFQAAKMAGRVALLPGDRPGLLQLSASGLIAAVTPAGGRPEPLSIARLDAAAHADGTAGASADALTLAAQMTGVTLPAYLSPGIGRKMQSLSFNLALSGPVPATAGKPDPAATATVWRNAGGSLALRALHLADGPLTVDTEGRFQLDGRLRPEGGLTVRVQGLDETIDGLAARHVLSRTEVRALLAMLGLMMRPPDPAILQAPLRLRGGVISLGPVPLVRLPFH